MKIISLTEEKGVRESIIRITKSFNPRSNHNLLPRTSYDLLPRLNYDLYPRYNFKGNETSGEQKEDPQKLRGNFRESRGNS